MYVQSGKSAFSNQRNDQNAWELFVHKRSEYQLNQLLGILK